MKQLKKLKPSFWDHHIETGSHGHSGLNFAKKWKIIVFFTSIVALLPLLIMIVVEFSITRKVIEDEVKNSMTKMVASAAASVSIAGNPKTAAMEYIDHIRPDKDNDLFIVSQDGMLLSASYFLGPALTRHMGQSSEFKQKTGLVEGTTPTGTGIFISYSKSVDPDLIFVHVRSQERLSELWFKPRIKLMGYLIASIGIIILSIMGTATYLVGRIHKADQRRSQALHHAEYANKLASIGRLASGVAHEINNPLAIINQKTGLMLDLLELKQDPDEDGRLIPLTRDVIEAVTRCGSITKQLLDFARDMELNIQELDIEEVINQVLVFLKKEAESKSIEISVDIPKPVAGFECDLGSLQQIFLNLFNNAIAAMENGGKLDVSVHTRNKDLVVITVSDNGCGISDPNMIKIFEPFYTTRDDHYSTGMGLSITYGLVQEVGGEIRVKSKVNEGTCFTLSIPLKAGMDN